MIDLHSAHALNSESNSTIPFRTPSHKLLLSFTLLSPLSLAIVRFGIDFHLVRLAQANGRIATATATGVKYLKATCVAVVTHCLLLLLLLLRSFERATEAHFVVMSRCHVAMHKLPLAACRSPFPVFSFQLPVWKFVNGTLTLSYQDLPKT